MSDQSYEDIRVIILITQRRTKSSNPRTYNKNISNSEISLHTFFLQDLDGVNRQTFIPPHGNKVENNETSRDENISCKRKKKDSKQNWWFDIRTRQCVVQARQQKKIKSKERRESETRRRRREEKVIDCGFFICENLDSAPYTTKNSSHRLCFWGDLEETVSSFGCTIGGLRPATTTRSLPKTFLAINVRSFSLR